MTILAFAPSLWSLCRYAAAQDLYSHVFLIPPISGYLLYTLRDRMGKRLDWSPVEAMLLLIPVIFMTLLFDGFDAGVSWQTNDMLALQMVLFVTTLLAGVFLFLGAGTVRVFAFPLLFLYFIVPIPLLLQYVLNTALQYASAEVTHALFTISGTPFFRDGLTFALPNLTISVAPECSGIRSTLVLFITSLVAGYLLLRSNRNRTMMVLSVLPIAAVRNGLRIVTISLLTVKVDPRAIESALHTRGGPPFFVLSLVPLFALAVLLRRAERREDRKRKQPDAEGHR